jgi:hypothetical protein
MDWSSERVLDFGPSMHRRGLRYAHRQHLLWPVWAWRVVTPEPRDQRLNILQRVVLRLHIAGVRQYEKAGKLLELESELVAFVAGELAQMGLLEDGAVTVRGRRFLEEAELDVGDMRVGWVFQDTRTGRLLPRFVTGLAHAEVEADEKGRPRIGSGTKGNPRMDRAFVVSPGTADAIPPQPQDIIGAARIHRRHERRLHRAQLDIDAWPSAILEQVSLISQEPQLYHLLTFVYVPENGESEDEPWYVADPFGFGASPALREQLERMRHDAQGTLRDLLDRITGEQLATQRDAWRAMQALLREQAREEVERRIPAGMAHDETVRERLELAYVEIARLENETDAASPVDGAYLKLRQALEETLRLVRRDHEPGDAWRKLYGDESHWLPRDFVQTVIDDCARALGFATPLPRAMTTANPGRVKAICLRADISNLRPLCTAMLLAAADDTAHPLWRLAAMSPQWFLEMNEIVDAAGDQVHGGGEARSLAELRKHAERTVRLCHELLSALRAPVQTHVSPTSREARHGQE